MVEIFLMIAGIVIGFFGGLLVYSWLKKHIWSL